MNLADYLHGYVKGYTDACDFVRDALNGDLDGDLRAESSPAPTVLPSGPPAGPGADAPPTGPTAGNASSASGHHDPGPDSRLDEVPFRQGMVHALRASAEELRSQGLHNVAGELERRAHGIEAAP